jgi:Golgi nucleoside diphosphatase
MNKQFIQGEINTGEEQFINSSIMSQASDIAEKLTELECNLNSIRCYVESVEDGVVIHTFTEEAQDIFDVYYDQYTEELYELLNQQLHAIKA